MVYCVQLYYIECVGCRYMNKSTATIRIFTCYIIMITILFSYLGHVLEELQIVNAPFKSHIHFPQYESWIPNPATRSLLNSVANVRTHSRTHTSASLFTITAIGLNESNASFRTQNVMHT